MGNPFSNLDDIKLMELYKDGNDMAFEVIYSRHKDRVYSYLSRRLQDKELIDDVFQNTFIKFHKARGQYSSKYPLVKWIYTICRSELLDMLKKNKIQTVNLLDNHIVETPESHNFDIDLDSENTLSDNEKEALKLRYCSDKDFDEISEALNTTQANSRKLISRGLLKLRTKFSGGLK